MTAAIKEKHYEDSLRSQHISFCLNSAERYMKYVDKYKDDPKIVERYIKYFFDEIESAYKEAGNRKYLIKLINERSIRIIDKF